MVENLIVGTVLIAATVLLQTVGLILLSSSVAAIFARLRLHRHNVGKTMTMLAVVLGVFLIHTVEIWFWAFMLFAVRAVGSFEGALYFSTAMFSTAGADSALIAPQWRLVASFESVNGFVLIGWSIAYLVAASTRYGPFRSGEHF